MSVTVCNYKCPLRPPEQEAHGRMQGRSWILGAFFFLSSPKCV